MGVTGLLRLVQPFCETKPVSAYSGTTLGVDAYSWLHRAAICCAEQLVRGEHPTRLLQSIDNRVRVYEMHNVTLYFVFDGAPLKMKERVVAQRRRAREEAKACAERDGSASASTFMKRAVEITSDHAAMVMAYLRARGIRFVVAPYEADAQLVYMEKQGFIDGIISEDSDMLVFGAQRLLTKADANSGQTIEVNVSKLPASLASTAHLRALAILAGCDYSPGIPGIGPIKAQKLAEANGGNLDLVLTTMRRQDKCDDEFIEVAKNANAAFLFQRVWDPERCVVTYLNSPEVELQDSTVQPLLLSPATPSRGTDSEGTNSAGGAPLAAHHLTDNIVGGLLPRPVAHRIATGVLDPHDTARVLKVQPHINAYVSKLTPFKPPRAPKLSTPLTASKEVTRRLHISPTRTVSSYFENKENLFWDMNTNIPPPKVRIATRSQSCIQKTPTKVRAPRVPQKLPPFGFRPGGEAEYIPEIKPEIRPEIKREIKQEIRQEKRASPGMFDRFIYRQ